VIATGARYRRLAVDGLQSFEGTSVHYWASPLEAKLCAGQEVALVGAGNSAGQAAVYLASQVSKVWLLVRGPDLSASMSRYLVDRIAGLSNVEVLTQTNSQALRAATECSRRSAGARANRAGKFDGPFDICFCSSEQTRTRIGCPGRTYGWIQGIRVDGLGEHRQPSAARDESEGHLCDR
jgi:thioredoxin reductase